MENKKLFWNEMEDGMYYRGFRIILNDGDEHYALYDDTNFSDFKTRVSIPVVDGENHKDIYDRIEKTIDVKADEIGLPESVKCLKVFKYDENTLKSEYNKGNKIYELNKLYRFSDKYTAPDCGLRGFHTYFTIEEVIESYCCICEMSGLYDVSSKDKIAWEYMTILEQGLEFEEKFIKNEMSDTEFLMDCIKSGNKSFNIPVGLIRNFIDSSKEFDAVLSYKDGKFNIEFKFLTTDISSKKIIDNLYYNLVYGIKKPEDFNDNILNDDTALEIVKEICKIKYYYINN